MQKDPKDRYLNAAELAEDLRKPNAKARPSMRRLPNGDQVVLDTNDDARFSLILASEKEKPYWSLAMPLRYSESFYKLEEVIPSGVKGPRWYYHFSSWPEQEILRGLVDYDQHISESAAAASEKRSFFGKIFGKK